ncbi:MAG: hypothetical protein LBN38_04985, partial [Verrucomicrobiota bacterium]|nr:hypothetical protein [Verrucomicrobiota bacterium]MDR0993905.1 hypothetical protein [Verrucomicrobiota bacterium]
AKCDQPSDKADLSLHYISSCNASVAMPFQNRPIHCPENWDQFYAFSFIWQVDTLHATEFFA